MSNLNSFIPPSGLWNSNENFDVTENLTGADAIAPDESDTLAAAVSEITADEAGLAAGNDQLDAASIAADGLETISESVAAANEGEGISEETAEIVEASVESLLKVARIGIKFRQLGLPTTESFSVKANRVKMGQATVEALNDSAKKIWKTIVEAIKKSIEWVRNFFNKIFGAAENLQRRAAKLKESTTSLSGTAEEANLENNSLFNAVAINGSPVKSSDLTTLAGEAKKIFAGQKEMTDKLSAAELEGSGPNQMPQASTYGLKSADSGTAKRVTADSDVFVSVTSRFPGENVIYLVLPKSVGATGKEMTDAASKIKSGAVNLQDKKAEGKSLKTLSIDEIKAMASGVEAFAKEVTEYKRNLTSINENKNKFIAKLEKFLSKGDGKNAEDKKDESEKKAKAQATGYRKLMDEPAASLASNAVRSMSAALQYAELSARQYTKG